MEKVLIDLGWLPPLIECDWNRFDETLERAHAVFWKDFGDSSTRPLFLGRRLGLKRHPEFEGKSATFWHFVSEGAEEAQRTPNRQRLERIGWARALIHEASQEPCRVKVWGNRRNSSPKGPADRWVVALEDFSYVVILDDRGDYLLPWTAYTVEEEHRRRKLRVECAAWLASRPKS